MSTLSFEGYTMPSASLGKLNPLPDIRKTADAHVSIPIDEETVTREEAQYMGWGRVNGILPYLIQDGYDRKKQPRTWNSAVLENEKLRATFLPELGGRLWSLFDKVAGRELLHVNPVFQPCNLGLRNAWISGGVEWNCGIIGHTPFTVDAMYTEALELEDGTPVLRMYQYERVRRLVYRVEAMLPEDSAYLYVRVRIDNASKEDTAVYWWSNMAVDERPDVRVVVPADRSFRWGYGGRMSKVGIPYMEVDLSQLRGSQQVGKETWDISHTTHIPQAMDFFFDLPTGQRRWISAVGGDGYGFAQTSTDVLKGRKLFVWGMGAGGRNWQTFLAQPGHAYLEIQAGLAHTQLEHLPMAGGQVIDWMEAYGPVTADAASIHGTDWHTAIQAVEGPLEAVCPRDQVEAMLGKARAQLDNRSGKAVQAGMAWAVVQRERLGGDFLDGGLAFPAESAGAAEQSWLTLVRERILPCPEVLAEPDSYQVGSEWEALLRETIEEGGSDHWYGQYQYGVTLAYGDKLEAAEAAFKASLGHARNPWALRCLGILCQQRGALEEAAAYLEEAVGLLPERNLAREAMQMLGECQRPTDVVRVYNALPAEVQQLGRLKVMLIEALLDTGDTGQAEDLLGSDIELTDVREGEVKLTDLWFRMVAMKRATGGPVSDALLAQVKLECTPPAHLDFRMH